MTRITVFDLETQRLAEEVGGWSNIRNMGFAVGVTYDVNAKRYARFTESQTDDLIDLLYRSDYIIGFNLIRFDFEVLRPYGFHPSQPILDKSTDLLLNLYQNLGFRISLNNLAQATLGEEKLADGLAAVRWFREGKIDKVFNYCEQDVRVTYELWRYGAMHGSVYYKDRRGYRTRVDVTWTFSSLTPVD
jgi:DEAD/DEAH box helicase domain-containing protein